MHNLWAFFSLPFRKLNSPAVKHWYGPNFFELSNSKPDLLFEIHYFPRKAMLMISRVIGIYISSVNSDNEHSRGLKDKGPPKNRTKTSLEISMLGHLNRV